MKLIDKDALVAEIERRITDNKKDIERASHKSLKDYFEGYEDALALLKQQYLDTIETKDVDTWHLQEKEDIYDAVKYWGLYTFACIMKDGTIQRFSGCLDEDCEGHINVHIDGVNDDYDDVDDIVKWIEYT